MSNCSSDQQRSSKANEITLVPGYFWVCEVYGISPPVQMRGTLWHCFSNCFTIPTCPLDLNGTGCSLWGRGERENSLLLKPLIPHHTNTVCCIHGVYKAHNKLQVVWLHNSGGRIALNIKHSHGLVRSTLALRYFCQKINLIRARIWIAHLHLQMKKKTERNVGSIKKNKYILLYS